MINFQVIWFKGLQQEPPNFLSAARRLRRQQPRVLGHPASPCGVDAAQPLPSRQSKHREGKPRPPVKPRGHITALRPAGPGPVRASAGHPLREGTASHQLRPSALGRKPRQGTGARTPLPSRGAGRTRGLAGTRHPASPRPVLRRPVSPGTLEKADALRAAAPGLAPRARCAGSGDSAPPGPGLPASAPGAAALRRPPRPGDAPAPAAPARPPDPRLTRGLPASPRPRAARPAPLPSLLPRIRQHRFCSRTFGDFWSGVAILARDGPREACGVPGPRLPRAPRRAGSRRPGPATASRAPPATRPPF